MGLLSEKTQTIFQVVKNPIHHKIRLNGNMRKPTPREVWVIVEFLGEQG